MKISNNDLLQKRRLHKALRPNMVCHICKTNGKPKRWRREKDLERECVREMEKRAGSRVGAGTQRASSSQGFRKGVLG